jgi:hypothetical protein
VLKPILQHTSFLETKSYSMKPFLSSIDTIKFQKSHNKSNYCEDLASNKSSLKNFA